MIKLADRTYYTTEEVKDLFKVDKNYFSKQVSLGLIPRSKIGKSYLFSEADLITWIENNKIVGKEQQDQDQQEPESKKKEAVNNEIDREYLLKFIEANSIELISEFLTSSDDEEVLSNSDWIVDCTIEEKQKEIKAYLKGIALA